jgi:hypothetical protein
MDRLPAPFVCVLYVVGGLLALGLAGGLLSLLGSLLPYAALFGTTFLVGWILHNFPAFEKKPPADPEEEDEKPNIIRVKFGEFVKRLEGTGSEED